MFRALLPSIVGYDDGLKSLLGVQGIIECHSRYGWVFITIVYFLYVKLLDTQLKTNEHMSRVSMAALFIVGVVELWAGFNYPMMYFDLNLFGAEPYQITKTILSVSLIIIGLLLMKGPHMTVAMISVITGISASSFSLTNLLFGMGGDYMLDELLSIPLMFIAVLYRLRKERYRAYATGIFAISMFVISVFSEYRLSLLGGFGLLISGFMFMLLGMFGLIRKKVICYSGDRDYGFEMVSIAGFMFVSLYCVISSLDIYDYPYYMVSFLLSLSIIFIAVWGLMDGVLIESLVQFMYGFSSLIFATDRLLGGQGYVITDLGFALIIGICGVMLLLRRQYTLAIPCILFGVLIIPGSAFEQGFMWGVASLSMLPFFAYYSISRWLYRDLGKEILPITE